MSYPVDLEDRVGEAEHIVLGKVIEQVAYWDEEQKGIYTLNIVEVSAWMKGGSSATQIGVITIGGVVGDKAMMAHPAIQLHPWNEYVLLLGADEKELDDKVGRNLYPGMIQAFTVADAQGAITKQSGVFHDLLSEPEHTEASLLSRIGAITGESAQRPDGRAFLPREGDTFPLSEWTKIQQSSSKTSAPITSFSPATTHGGTIVTSDFVTINGSGFGATPGAVFYTNADNGGATLTTSGIASDNVSWNDSQIQNKPPSEAGTGPIDVNGVFTSGSDLTVQYTHIEVNNIFAGHSQVERQELKHIDANGAGGYTFTYNNTFAANASATASFERALDTWRCATQINFEMAGSNSAVASTGLDGTNIVLFDATLPNGVLGRATTFFNAGANGACNAFNTVWFIPEIDIAFKPDPPAGCCPWNFGPGSSTFTQFDFESVAVHELGHAHGLGHVIAPGEVMHFALANGTDARSLSPNDLAGGTAKMIRNLIPLCFNPAGVNGNMSLFSNLGICGVLDVDGIVFRGERISPQAVALEWEVDLPREPAGFEVWRSRDGKNFVPIGQPEVARIAGEPFSYIDGQAPAERNWFYQLIVRDVDGQATQSDVVEILADGVAIEVFPTVVSTWVNIRGNNETDQAAAGMVIFDPTGKQVFNRSLTIERGPFEVGLNLPVLSAGIYYYRFNLEGAVKTGKLVVAQ